MAILPLGEKTARDRRRGGGERKKSGVSLYGASACVRPLSRAASDFTSASSLTSTMSWPNGLLQ